MVQVTAKILVVDDDERIRRIMRDMLIYHGHKVITVGDGDEAVASARTDKPDLIFMDVFMPKMDGYTALDAIKKDVTTREIPVVMLTAVGHDLNRKLAEQLGSAGYLTKPFVARDLLDAVGRFARNQNA